MGRGSFTPMASVFQRNKAVMGIVPLTKTAVEDQLAFNLIEMSNVSANQDFTATEEHAVK